MRNIAMIAEKETIAFINSVTSPEIKGLRYREVEKESNASVTSSVVTHFPPSRFATEGNGSMPALTEAQPFDQEMMGIELYSLILDLYPIFRSITGEGVRRSLRMLQQYIPMVLREVPSGTPVFDWTVPREWNVNDAWVKNGRGEKVIDFRRLNLHLMSYSIPIHKKMGLAELKRHLYTDPSHPSWVPYRTSYYEDAWGFCVSQETFDSLPEGEYEVLVDSTLTDGQLTYGETYLPGEISDEVLISCHVCHPSLCNDNLSGMALATLLARHLMGRKRRYSYRFLFVPGTIGSITWLALNEQYVSRIKHGLVAACLGDSGGLTYKKSRRGNTEIDQVVQEVLEQSGEPHAIIDFSPYGYDERQYCSPGFNLPVGRLTRTPNGKFPEYHTSADDLSFVKPTALGDSFAKMLTILETLERRNLLNARLAANGYNRTGIAQETEIGTMFHNRRYLNTQPKCEPQLGRRGLFRLFGGKEEWKEHEQAMLWVLNYSDGQHSLLDIAERSGIDLGIVRTAAQALCQHGLLAEMG